MLPVKPSAPSPRIAIACGGTGGHLFPGLAVAEQLILRGCDVTLLVSPKEVDQQAVRNVTGMDVVTLPAVGLSGGNIIGFARGFWKSHRAARRCFAKRPQAVLAMGGFTSAPPVLAGRAVGALTFLHESNTIPGRANRWLAHIVTQAFVGFPESAAYLHHSNILCTGTPVRPGFQPGDPGAARVALGLHPSRPLVLVMGGSQGATGVNDLFLRALPSLLRAAPELQYLHLTGPNDAAKAQVAYDSYQARAVVRPFLTEMEFALAAATVAVSRAGASSLAEFAALRVPAVLIPYPSAADNHQFFNARAYVETGAAYMLEQGEATDEQLAADLLKIITDQTARASMIRALERWDAPHASALIAARILAQLDARSPGRWHHHAPPVDPDAPFESRMTQCPMTSQ